MPLARIPVTADGPTIRFSALARAVGQAGSLPVESSKRLNGYARAIRGFAEARERELARMTLADVEAFADDLDNAGESPALVKALRRHVGMLEPALASL